MADSKVQAFFLWGTAWLPQGVSFHGDRVCRQISFSSVLLLALGGFAPNTWGTEVYSSFTSPIPSEQFWPSFPTARPMALMEPERQSQLRRAESSRDKQELPEISYKLQLLGKADWGLLQAPPKIAKWQQWHEHLIPDLDPGNSMRVRLWTHLCSQDMWHQCTLSYQIHLPNLKTPGKWPECHWIQHLRPMNMTWVL